MAQKRKDWILANKERILSKQFRTDISSTFINSIYDNRELKALHGTYQYELQMLEYVRTGNTPALKDLLLGYTDSETYEEGTVAKDDLRQVKNIFIALVAMVGKTAAIEGLAQRIVKGDVPDSLKDKEIFSHIQMCCQSDKDNKFVTLPPLFQSDEDL